MLLYPKNAGQVILETVAQNLDGSPKTSLNSAKVKVYHISGGVEVTDVPQTDLTHVGTSNIWRYIWTPATLPENHYIVEYSLIDTNLISFVGVEDLIVADFNAHFDFQEIIARLNSIDDNLAIVRKVETGRWKIINNQMIFYEDDKTTPLLVFDLKDQFGRPTDASAYERVPV